MNEIKAPRGAPDLFPPASELLSEMEGVARSLFDTYGYRRIETPAFEHTEVFVRTVGESSDIVRKEMYTFDDRSGRSLTLRPEGTAPVARAYVEHSLWGSLPAPVRLWYVGPMFRYERPQTGRTRQFFQMGVEVFGSASPVCDAEVIMLAAEFYDRMGLAPELLLNSIGCPGDRERYRGSLRASLEPSLPALCPDCHTRLETNPMRVFDCKVPACREVLASPDIPRIVQHLCGECAAHFDEVKDMLQAAEIKWVDAPDLVRGLDYYTRTVFEFDVASLGARSAVGSGGRYDGLVEQLGGPPTPGIGMAIGVEPTSVALRAAGRSSSWAPDVYVAWLGALAPRALTIARDLRRAGLRVVTSEQARSLKAQLRAADRLGARRVVILGERDIERGVATLRNLEQAEQHEVQLDELVVRLTGDR